jgi:hypothetical protein
MLSFCRTRCAIAALAIACALSCALAAARADTIYESATLGTTGKTSGAKIQSTQYLGVRFSVSSPMEATAIGGHFSVLVGSQFFGAIVRLSSPTDFPDSNDLSSSDVLASTLLSAPRSSAQVSASIGPVTLSPGTYAMMFGAGQFGSPANTLAIAPADDPNIGTPSYFFRNTDGSYSNGNFSHTRFFLTGTPGAPVVVPLPATGRQAGLLLICLFAAAFFTRKYKNVAQ